MIVSNVICNRWVGQDFGDWRSKIDRVICPFIIGCEAWLWTHTPTYAALSFLAFPIWRYDGWGEQFLAIHGNDAAYKGRNTDKLITKIADKLYIPVTISQRKLYGVMWGGLRGLYDLPAFIILSVLLQNPYIAILGLLMGLQGAAYYLSGALFPNKGTPPAELIMGFLRGSLWLGTFYA